MSDNHRLLPRYRYDQQDRALANVILDTDASCAITTKAKPTLPAGGDAWQLRGIPAIGYGIPGGAIAGTRPDTARIDDNRTT